MSQNLNIVLQPILFSFTLIDKKEFPLLIISLWVLKGIVVSIMTRVNSWKTNSVIFVYIFKLKMQAQLSVFQFCGFEIVFQQ
jgi:ethanolamine transporter EutH